MMLFDLRGRVALVTGGAGHLGSEISRGLAAAGARVLVNGRNSEKAERHAAALRAEGYAADALPFDIADKGARDARIGELTQLDILVNNATTGAPSTIETTPLEAFAPSAMMEIEVPYAMIRTALPLMRKNGPGSIVNIASMYGMVSPDPRIYGASGYNNPPQYGAAKAGLLQLTRYLACHLAPEGIRVNAVSPGPFPPADKLRAEQPQFLRALEEKVPMRRVGAPTEVAGAVVFLASDAASYVTGANIPVDGGWTAW